MTAKFSCGKGVEGRKEAEAGRVEDGQDEARLAWFRASTGLFGWIVCELVVGFSCFSLL
ncbi:hypothetical protein SAMN04487969_105243 [Paenibacillus algorifonticola]|uniref:Uncharacterized protein n=1 Tax=Paenibacillus algorifonticola TaxID=684063 RepID=A0A1I2CTW2_9BACL|nr:hypothetical protein SAMN04487969_105243 [Paenibacillus algorifonticola]